MIVTVFVNHFPKDLPKKAASSAPHKGANKAIKLNSYIFILLR